MQTENSKGEKDHGIRSSNLDDPHCDRCGRRLNPDRAVWLDLNSHTLQWTDDPKGWPDHVSQGAFAFGPECAAAALRESSEAVR